MNRKVQLGGKSNEMRLPFRHLVPPPAYHRIIVDGQSFVWHYQIFVNSNHGAVAAAGGAGPIGVVEAEEIGVGFFESDAVGLEAVGEMACFTRAAVGLLGMDNTAAASLEKSCLHRLGHAGGLVVNRQPGHRVVGMYLNAVHQQCHIVSCLPGHWVGSARGQIVLYADDGPFHRHAHKTLLVQHLQLWTQGVILAGQQRGENGNSGSFGMGEDIVHHIAHRVAFHLHARHRRIGAPDAGEHQLEVFIQLRRGADCRARIARVHLLLDGHRRGDVLNQVHLGLGHAAEKLACIARKALHIASLSLGIEGVEGQARLAASAQAGDDHQLPLRDIDRDVLQIIDARAVYLYHCQIVF